MITTRVRSEKCHPQLLTISPQSSARRPGNDSPARRGVSFSPYSLRLCAFALICCSLLASSPSAGYRPETEGLQVMKYKSPKGA